MIIELPYPRHTTRAAKPTSAHRGRTRLLTITCCAYLLLLLATWILLRGAGDRWWPATALMLAPRWPLALPLLVLWPCALLSRRYLPLTVTTLAIVLALGPIMGGHFSAASLHSARADLRLLTCNIHRQHVDVDALAEYISSVNPDVVALQGWSESGHGTLFAPDAHGAWHTQRLGELLVASRLPILSATPIRLPEQDSVPPGERGAAAIFKLQTAHGPLHLINLHLASPHAGLVSITADGGTKLAANINRRRDESEAIRAIADPLEGSVILSGDFNTTDDSPLFRENWSDDGDAFATKGSGFGLTYFVRSTQLRIDHILAGSRVQVVKCFVGIDVGSPHRPFVADLNCR